MKLLISVFTILLSLEAFAATHIEHDFGHVLNGIELSNACLTNLNVQTILTPKICVEKKPVTDNNSEGSPVDYICTRWETQPLSYSRTYTTQECAQYKNGYDGDVQCEKYRTVKKIMPRTIQIRTWTETRDYNNYPGVVSRFTFPLCK